MSQPLIIRCRMNLRELEQEYLYLASGWFVSMEPGRENPGIIYNQHIAGLNIMFYITENPVLERIVLPMYDEEFGLFPVISRFLSDIFFREFEIVGVEVKSCCMGLDE